MRRSTRGGPPPPPASATSSSSLSSARQDRTARAQNLSNKSTTPHSLSSEEELPRRSQRAQPPAANVALARPETAAEDGEAVDEEEVTRCICAQTEYPGPPEIDTFAGIADAGDLFIQCDGCTVWQHGGCVGIAEESQCPDKYFCEDCRPELHQINRDSKGQNYTLYLPLHPQARKASMSKHDDKAKKEREALLSRASVDPSTGKRRATMRSKEHDDEEEQLKRAIEESRREVEGPESSGRRNGKRGRDESEDKQDLKRQRTASGTRGISVRAASPENDADEEQATSVAGKLKRAKAETMQSTRQAEQSQKEKEREVARAEAAGRRQERAGRRRADEADNTEESTPKPTPSAQASPPLPSSQPPSPPPATEKIPHKKGFGKRVKKLGNNQYTKNRGEPPAASPHGRKRGQASPSGDEIVAVATNGDTPHAASKTSPPVVSTPLENGIVKGKFGRGKKAAAVNGNGVKAPGEEVEKTFPNMKAALDTMSRWVAGQHVDFPVGGSPVTGTAAPAVGADAELKFEELSSGEMAERLQKGITRWHEQWSHLA